MNGSPPAEESDPWLALRWVNLRRLTVGATRQKHAVAITKQIEIISAIKTR
jgi:hypothetical protein